VRTWREAHRADRCYGCPGLEAALLPGEPALEVTLAGGTVTKVFCRRCAERVLHEPTPSRDQMAAASGPTVPQPSLLRETPRHQGFVTAGELAQRAQRQARWRNRQQDLTATVMDSPLYRPKGVRNYLEAREPGEEG